MKKIIIALLIVTSYSSSFGQSWLWGIEGTTMSNTTACRVAADSKGNALFTGYFLDSITFSGVHLTSANYDIYLIKYDSLGNLLWARQSIGGPYGAYSYNAATDTKGNIYITGYFDQSISFGSYTLTNAHPGGYDVFLVKYNAVGNVVWAWQSGGSNTGWASGSYISIDPKGNILVGGGFKDTVNFGAVTMISKTTYNGDAFIMKCDSNGNLIWAKQSNAAFHSTARNNSVATDAAGNVFTTGTFTDTVTFGTHKLINKTHKGDVYLLKYDSTGNLLWANQCSNSLSIGWASSLSVATDLSGNAYITGDFEDSVLFDTNVFTSKHFITEMFLAKYKTNDSLVWIKQSFGSPTSGSWQGNSLKFDAHNDLFLCGSSTGAINDYFIFDNDTLIVHDNFYPAVELKLDVSGNILCGSVTTSGGIGSLACDPSGKYVYLGGCLTDSITFNKDFLSTFGGNEPPFLARWLPCNNVMGIDKITSRESETMVFPNPNKGKFSISISNSELNAKSSIYIYNTLGEKVYSSQISQLVTQFSLQRPPGVYLYRVISSKGELFGTGKVLIE